MYIPYRIFLRCLCGIIILRDQIANIYNHFCYGFCAFWCQIFFKIHKLRLVSSITCFQYYSNRSLCFFEPFFTDYLLENDFMKNKSAVRCGFPYFLGLFSKAFFILLHRRCDKLYLCPFCFPEPLAEKAMRFLRNPRNHAGLSL